MAKNKSCLKWSGGALLLISISGLVLYLGLRTEKRVLDDTARGEASGNFIELPLGWTHYLQHGSEDGPSVVLVHGFSVPSYVWEPTINELGPAGFRVLAYDLYGRGYSDRPDLDYDLHLFYHQLDDLLNGLEGSSSVCLAGLSMGGPIVARYAGEHAEQVRAVVLVAPEVAVVTNRDIFPLNLPLVGEVLMSLVMEPVVLPGLQGKDFAEPEQHPDWERRYRVQLQYRGTGRALLSTIRELTELEPAGEYQRLADLGIPVLLVWGTQDQTILREDIQLLESMLPEMETILVEGAGHLPHYDRPAEVNQALIKFLAEHGCLQSDS